MFKTLKLMKKRECTKSCKTMRISWVRKMGFETHIWSMRVELCNLNTMHPQVHKHRRWKWGIQSEQELHLFEQNYMYCLKTLQMNSLWWDRKLVGYFSHVNTTSFLGFWFLFWMAVNFLRADGKFYFITVC